MYNNSAKAISPHDFLVIIKVPSGTVLVTLRFKKRSKP